MDNTMIPIIVTIGISTLIIVASLMGTFFILLNYLGGRIDQSEARIMQAAAKNKAELLDAIRDTEQRMTETMRSDKAELQETIRDTENRVTEGTRDSEQRLSRRLDRFEDKTDANFEALRRESSERPAEQPVAGDD